MEKKSNNILSFFAKHFVWLFSIFFGIPLAIQLSSLVINGVDSGKYVVSGDWLAFWGGYLGVMPAGIMAWWVAEQQIKSDRKNARLAYIEQRYIEDLLKLRDIINSHSFSGEWIYPYNLYFSDIEEVTKLTSEEVTLFRKMFLNISVDKDGKEIIMTDSLFDLRSIIYVLPSSQNASIKQSADLMCENILLLAQYQPSMFKTFEDESNKKEEYDKITEDLCISKHTVNRLDWQTKSKEFADHIRIITENFNTINTHIDDELVRLYKLDD